jgi:hypothetical protein
MTDKLLPPKKKNPQLRQMVPTLPPQMRSRAALGLTVCGRTRGVSAAALRRNAALSSTRRAMPAARACRSISPGARRRGRAR